MKIEFIKDEKLFFGNNKRKYDPRIGLLSGGPKGPYERDKNPFKQLDCGLIGNEESITIFEEILKEIKNGINPFDTVYGEKGFPGLGKESPLQFSINIERDWCKKIHTKEIDDLSKIDDFNELKDLLLQLYKKKMEFVLAYDSKPNIIIILIPDEILNLFDKLKRKRRIIRFANKTDPDSIVESEGDIDFHNIIKIIGMEFKIPTQLIRYDTLKEISKGLETKLHKRISTEDPATFAWNFVVGLYYKAIGTPWKLVELDENVCYIGISFFRDYAIENLNKPNLRASLAQIFIGSGEMYVLRGEPFDWDEDESKTPQLTTEYAKSLIDTIINFYLELKGHTPKRIVIHKSSKFSKEEIVGFYSNTKGIKHIDMITIYNTSLFRLYRDSRYPVVRGTVVLSNKKNESNFLYTVGFIPVLSTYPGPRVPVPLEFKCFTFDTDRLQIAKEILSLSRLDWNNIKYSTSKPVTLLLSERVGEIMSEARSKKISTLETEYRYYM